MNMWPIEVIPNNSRLYYRIHQTFIRNGKMVPSVFKERGEGESCGMSTDWEKYSTPEESRNRAPIPEKNGIVSFIAGNLRDVNLEVIHAPSNHNRAHTNVKGIDVESRLKLLDIFKWEIQI